MKFFDLFKKTPKKPNADENIRDILKNKYLSFQNLLRENNNVLSIMADMEEKLSGEYLFDRQYINSHSVSAIESVSKIIDHINALTFDKYKSLYKIQENIAKEIEKILKYKREIPVSELAIPLEALNKDMPAIAGGKIAHLGEIRNHVGLLTPDGFAVSAYAFKRFMEHNMLSGKLNEKLAQMSIDNIEELNETCKEIRLMIINAEIPDDLGNAIKKAVEDLNLQAVSGSQLTVSVRSSAINEDGEFSFAGQYATFLNVRSENINEKYKEVLASLFTPRAIFYYKTKGFSEEDIVMAVGVLRMIDARSAGVMYTKDPNDPEKDIVIINALRGLGKSVVDGVETPDSYIVSKETGEILQKNIAEQKTMTVCKPEGGTEDIDLTNADRSGHGLTDEQIKTIFSYGLKLEGHYARPQDIEWAVGADNKIYILQSRPLMIFKTQSSQLTVPRRIQGYEILIDKGVVACKGVGYGEVFIIKEDEDLQQFPDNAVLVARRSSTKFVTVMNKASAIITDVGSATGHMASLTREYNVPAILDTGNATAVFTNGQEITVDAINCNIYSGKVDELIEYASKKKEPFKDTHLFKTLEKVLKLIVPLNLIDPDAKNFRSESCATLHDITRFVHEMAMAAIFKTGQGEDVDSLEDMLSAIAYAESGEAKRLGPQTTALRAGIPVDAHLLDIDGGIRTPLKKAKPEDIVSIPFSAFLKGMMKMKWPEPRPADVKGFLGMVAHTASIQEEELLKAGGRSYAIISHNYMTFSIRLGYHFSLVEAYAGENMNDNYIKFFFKGGGAATDRRLRRVRLITEIIREMDFKFKVTSDVIDAILTKYKKEDIEKRLEVMGKLTAYTKQLDMVMYNEAVTDMFIEDFIRDHMKTMKREK